MKKLLPLAAALLSPFAIAAQTTLFSEDFNGNTNGFTLNTSDMSSATAGYNTWLVNNSYTGGSGSLTCMSFPLTYTIANTAQQPASIAGFPTSRYMHIISQEAITDGITCGSYLAADGFCYFAENNFTKMTSTISTVGYTNTTLSFWWLCGGSVNGYGEVYYSTDGGVTWTAVSGQYLNNTNAWQLQTVYDSNFDNKPSLCFGFRFANNNTTSAADPGFCIDDVGITGQLGMGLATYSLGVNLTVMPNPANDQLNFTWNIPAQSDVMQITITDITGAMVRNEERPFSSVVNLDAAELSNGVYFLHVTCGAEEAVRRFSVVR